MKKDTKTFLATIGSIVGVLSFATMTSAYITPVEYIRQGIQDVEQGYEALETETPDEQIVETVSNTAEPIQDPTPVVVDEGLSPAEAERIRKQIAELQASIIAKQQAAQQPVVTAPKPTQTKTVSKPKPRPAPSRTTRAS